MTKKEYDRYITGKWNNEETTLKIEAPLDINVFEGAVRFPIFHFGCDFGKESKRKLPERYIINEGATILFWDKEGKDKTIVKRSKDDEFNKRLGFLTAYFQYHSGLSKTKANKYLDSLEVEKEKEKQETKKSKILDEIDINLEKAKKEVDKIIFGK